MKRLVDIGYVETHFGVVEVDIDHEDDIEINSLNAKAKELLEEEGVDAFESYETRSEIVVA